MVRALATRGCDVRVFPNEHALELGLPIINVEEVSGFLSEKKDLFIYHFCAAWPPGEALLKELTCTRIVKYHNITPARFFDGINAEYVEHCQAARATIPAIASELDALWGDSSYNVEEFLGHGVNADCCAVIPPFHHVEELFAEPDDPAWASLLSDGKRNIVVVGRLAPNKGHPLLLKAFAELRKKHDDVRLVIIGSKDSRLRAYHEALDSLVTSLGLEGAVRMAGKVSGRVLATVYRHADLFAITSEHEGFCVPLIEAMAFGVPVVALGTSAVPETMGDAGWLVTSDDAKDFAARMDEALSTHGHDLERMHMRGRQRFHNRYSTSATERRFLEVVGPYLAPVRRPVRAIHQFHSGTAFGDAVTNSMLMMRGMLRDLGFASEVYAQHVAPELAGAICPHTDLRPGPDDVVIIHHSMGHDLDEWVSGLGGHKLLCYHNITPAEFFPPDSPFRHYSVKGRRQVREFMSRMDAAIAVSALNARELIDCGYTDVEILPLLIDTDEIKSRLWNEQLVLSESGCLTVLFVGRVSPHKGHLDVLQAFACLLEMVNQPVRLVFVGGFDAEDPYYRQLCDRIAELGIQSAVTFTGKVSNEDLVAWYRIADVFLCLSDHEGFGIPVIEAMSLDLPVVAFDSSNIADTLGGAGVLIHSKNPLAVAGLVKTIMFDRALRRQIVEAQRVRALDFSRGTLLADFAAFLERQGILADVRRPKVEKIPDQAPIRFQVEGPLETSYSLALVNRQVAFGLAARFPGMVSALPTEGPGRYPVDQKQLAAIPGLADLVAKSSEVESIGTVVRNLYPPRVADARGSRNILCFAWEETGLDPDWVVRFNTWLDGIGAASSFVKKILRDNGVRTPITVYGHGVEHVPMPSGNGGALNLRPGFRFLHVSSCFPRKGVDVLINAYVKEFAGDPDVVLVIKTFPNPHQSVRQLIESLSSREGCPAIELIEADLGSEEVAQLYRACNAFVAPSRGEGFGLPMAEAMRFGLPVITTNYGGQTDFCTEETAWLVDYKFAHAQSHMNLSDSMWAEPDLDSLRRQMRAVRSAFAQEVERKVATARAFIAERCNWQSSADKLIALDDYCASVDPLHGSRPVKLGWFSSWNTKCGIAIYSGFLISQLNAAEFDVRIFASHASETLEPDDGRVVRCWTDQFGNIDGLLTAISEANLDVLVIQHNFAFLSMQGLAAVLNHCHRLGITTVVTFHSTADVTFAGVHSSLGQIASELRLASRLLVHSVDDVNRLKGFGLVDNVAIFPHGVMYRARQSQEAARQATNLPVSGKVVAAYGFMLPHKGFEQLIEAFATLLTKHPDSHLLMVCALYPQPVSEDTLRRCVHLAQSLGCASRVRFVSDFLPDEASMALLDCADLVVFPYQNTAESSSAAVRYGLASRRAVACTPLQIFSDVDSAVHRLPGTAPADIARGLDELLSSPEKLAATAGAQDRWLQAHAWPMLGYRLGGMLQGLRLDDAVARKEALNS
ncbi:glycosyltransferase family 4 protein [Cupriavidus oxalaticus]|nr:glycosyltransferase [Cupriavidus oxalaticus]